MFTNKFDKSKMFSFINNKDAKKFIGSYGFFANSISDLKFIIKNNDYKKLDSVAEDDTCEIDAVFSTSNGEFYGLFYPLKYATDKPAEIIRPFKDIDELKKVTELDVGSIITLRDCIDYDHVFKALITAMDNEGVHIGRNYYTINELHQEFEYYFKDNWFRFGVKEFV